MPEVVEDNQTEKETRPYLVSEKQNQVNLGDEHTMPTTQGSQILGVASTTSPKAKKFKRVANKITPKKSCTRKLN